MVLDRQNVELVTHMALPCGVRWSKNGWYLRLRNGAYRWVCGLTEIENPALMELLSRAQASHEKNAGAYARRSWQKRSVRRVRVEPSN